MIVKARSKKRYGPVHRRGVSPRILRDIGEVKRKESDHDAVYRVPAGTVCHVRKLGEQNWRPHTTRRPIECRGYLWRNERWYGFSFAGYEIKVLGALVRVC
jgi:hypothetical protein